MKFMPTQSRSNPQAFINETMNKRTFLKKVAVASAALLVGNYATAQTTVQYDLTTEYRTLVADTTIRVKNHPYPVTVRFFNTTSPSKSSFNSMELESNRMNMRTGAKEHFVYNLERLSGELAEDGKTVKQYFFGFTDGKGTFTFWEEAVEGIGTFFRDGRFRCRIPFKD